MACDNVSMAIKCKTESTSYQELDMVVSCKGNDLDQQCFEGLKKGFKYSFKCFTSASSSWFTQLNCNLCCSLLPALWYKSPWEIILNQNKLKERKLYPNHVLRLYLSLKEVGKHSWFLKSYLISLNWRIYFI